MATKNVRIWEDVHALYKEVADEYGLVLSDLISAVLLEVAAFNLPFIVYVLMKHFDIRYEVAVEAASKLMKKTWDLFSLAEKIEQVKEIGIEP